MKPKKATTIRIRPFEGDAKIAKIIAERTGLSLINVMSYALQAGLKAIEENNYRIGELPIEMKVVPNSERKDIKSASTQPLPTKEGSPGESVLSPCETSPPDTSRRNKPKP